MIYKELTSNINEIGKKAMKLSTRDRALLIRQLLESLDAGDEEENAEELWNDEIKRRYNRYKQAKASEKPANKVLEDGKANLK